MLEGLSVARGGFIYRLLFRIYSRTWILIHITLFNYSAYVLIYYLFVTAHKTTTIRSVLFRVLTQNSYRANVVRLF